MIEQLDECRLGCSHRWPSRVTLVMDILVLCALYAWHECSSVGLVSAYRSIHTCMEDYTQDYTCMEDYIFTCTTLNLLLHHKFCPQHPEHTAMLIDSLIDWLIWGVLVAWTQESRFKIKRQWDGQGSPAGAVEKKWHPLPTTLLWLTNWFTNWLTVLCVCIMCACLVLYYVNQDLHEKLHLLQMQNFLW